MDCREDSEFHDDSSRIAERAKESVLLMKKKMLRSHDLILQYNNKLKECERLKGELCTAQEDAAKLKRDHMLSLTKVVKLESQISDYKKHQLHMEQKIADQDIRIAGDKSHVEQLICKLDGLESKHSGMLIEADIRKSALEGRIKELEQELKKSKKLQQNEAENPERCKNSRKGKKSLTKGRIVDNETIDVGVNTMEEYIPEITVKPTTVEKSVLTDEFYHTKDNPYPIFCDKCEALMAPNFEKFCRIMTNHPPLLSEMSSPPHPQILPEPSVSTNSNALVESLARNETLEYGGRLLDTVSPEIENLKRKITTLENKMKKRNKLMSQDSQYSGSNRCGHAHQANCCSSRGSSHAVPPILPNVQTDFMAEFWKRIMSFTNESSSRFNQTGSRDRRSKKTKFNKRRVKISTKSQRRKCTSSTNWEIESDDCGNEVNNSSQLRSREPHILRLKPSEDRNEESEMELPDHMDASSGRDRSCENSKSRGRLTSNVSDAGQEPLTKKLPRENDYPKDCRIYERRLRSHDEKASPYANKSNLQNSTPYETNRKASPYFSRNPTINSPTEVFEYGNARRNSSFDRSVSSSPSYDLTNEVFVKKSSGLAAISPRQADLNGTALKTASASAIGESRSFRSEEDLNDALKPEHYSEDEEPSESTGFLPIAENSRKRKRTISPLKTTNRSVKSKLLGKLRALKKNSNALVAKGSNHASVDEHLSRSVSQVSKISNESETECGEDSKKTDEPLVGVVTKRQRIAHVPKKSLGTERDLESLIAIEKEGFLPPNKSRRDVETSSKKSEGKSLGICGGTGAQEIQRPMLDNSFGKLNSPSTRNIGVKLNTKSLNTDEENVIKMHSVDFSEDAEENEVENKKQRPRSNPGDVGNSTTDAKIATSGDPKVQDPCHENAESSVLIDESPASPNTSRISHLSDSCADVTKSSDECASIYENALLPASTSMEDRSASNLDENIAPVPRNLIKYDTAIFSESQENLEKAESISLNSQFAFIEANSSAKMHNIVKDLRTRQIRCSPKTASPAQPIQQNFKSPSNEDNHEEGATIDAAAYQRGIRSLGTLLTRHIMEAKRKTGTRVFKVRKAAAMRLQTEAEKNVKNELEKLVETEEWSNAVHNEVTTRICQIPSRRTVAKAVVDFLVERADSGETLDRTYTPPAPVMTRTQQRIAALINSLERDPGMSGVFELVRAGIDFNLFRLGYPIQLEIIEFLVRMMTVLARMRKDRECVRILCCNSLYFLGRFASNAIYIVLSIWPEVFPMHGSRLARLANCMVHLLRLEQGPKAMGVKRLLKDYYKYPDDQMQSASLMNASINTLRNEYTGELEVSILLIAKKEGTEWAYKHVVNGGLLQIIEDPNYPFLLNALSLFGFVMRTFPTEDQDKLLATTVEKLCTMLKSTEGSPDKEEGIVSALLSLARYSAYFGPIADTILKWKPNRPMRTGTIEQLNSFFKLRSMDWWNKRKSDKFKFKFDE